MVSPVRSTLAFPTATSHPSFTCLQWSSDGQLFFATKSVLYILTPEYGITYDNAAVMKSISSDKNGSEQPAVGWFRTAVQFDEGEPCKWSEYSQDWSTVSLGSIDQNLWSVAISPSNLSSTSGCIVATLSSNLDLRLWSAARNSLKGEWKKVYDVTPYLLDKFQALSDDSQIIWTLHSQVTSICWTRANFGVTPTPTCSGSLLAVGNRAGSVILLRFVRDTLHFVQDITLDDHWITNLVFSESNLSEPGTASGILAYGTSSGALGTIEITQRLVEGAGSSLFGPDYNVETSVQRYGLAVQPDEAGIAAMQWIELATHILIVTLADGSFHVVQNFSSFPSWSEDVITSLQLSKVARSVFVEIQDGNVDSVDMNRITGATSFDGAFNLVWTQEAMRPPDFSYKHEAKHSSTLVVAKLFEDEESSNELLLENLAHLLESVRASSGRCPLDLLRPFLFRFSNGLRLDELHSGILQILRVSPADHTLTIIIPTCTEPLSDKVRRRFKESLTRHLFGYDTFLSLRMALALADFTWIKKRHSDMEERRMECGLIAQDLLNAISHRTLRTIIRHLGAVVTLLQPTDIHFVLRTVIQSLLPGSPPNLSEEAEILSKEVRGRIPIQESGSPENDEHCPACSVVVPLQDVTRAVCSNGHHWTRCSVTTFILSTPYVRTCIGCSRKAFLPLSTRTSPEQPNWLPPLARGWVVEELLEAVQRCLFCGNTFVRIL
ncbi:hypothetical protein AGABI1DRAFT_118415 [Agaricus bisporus var. burnettii JB137-S8]|uniref:Transcription factor IIIC putative zinc-finger domain-containing protein n=1 Tax=Agaricus bisporus var. burnettii (strain JB137-S8 / ATCC MYA-4627 / FGSC 10392) TaxID=597362 RepID=K5W828_AGABU|nr:uncharacterized protein AGABI1DRAFT_118415 [Agaricus bisporus var. burnettii JB137-S8]EKM83014.1 hypothetical protein AGABI1DRAFT_118415 [Agaricus bisporus var. burnettii JB137-S8]